MKPRIYDLSSQDFTLSSRPETESVLIKPLIPSGYTETKVILTKVEPGGSFQSHADAYHHVFYFIEGHGEGVLGEETYEIAPGRVVEVPAGMKHGYRNTFTSEMLLLTVNIPQSYTDVSI
jgi:mannose-6-phosphate isomerase-like protein (cupin superfamily)